MKLDEKAILDLVSKIKNDLKTKTFPKSMSGPIYDSETQSDMDNLKEMLGGDRLYDIFDSMTVNSLLEVVIETGTVHDCIPDGKGFDILEGLLNNQIIGNLSDFYMIKSDYILGLPPEQRKNMAESIADGRQDLLVVLPKLWDRGIRTEACTTKDYDNLPMIQMRIKRNEIENLDFMQKIYEQGDIKFSSDSYYDYETKEFFIRLSGENLYKYLQSENLPSATVPQINIFENSVSEALEFAEEMYKTESELDLDTSERKMQISDTKKYLEEMRNRNKQPKVLKSWELSDEDMNKYKRDEKKIYGDTDRNINNHRDETENEIEQ